MPMCYLVCGAHQYPREYEDARGFVSLANEGWGGLTAARNVSGLLGSVYIETLVYLTADPRAPLVLIRRVGGCRSWQ